MKKFNVIIWDVNLKVFKYYNVIPYLTDCYNKEKNKPVNVEDFKIFIERHSRNRWWARHEYEIVLKDCSGESEYKIDVHEQITMNIDIIAKILMEVLTNNKII